MSPPPHWLERGTPQYIASLIVDPPDGRMPPQTPEAQQRSARAARSGAAGRGPADSYTDRSLYDRCITRGMPGSILPVIYNNGNEIIQGPGWVVAAQRDDPRNAHRPARRPAAHRPKIRQLMGDSRGHWDGNTLVVETTNFDDRTRHRRQRRRPGVSDR